MIEWLVAIVKIGVLVLVGFLVMGLIGFGYAMAMFSWERLRELWRRE